MVRRVVIDGAGQFQVGLPIEAGLEGPVAGLAVKDVVLPDMKAMGVEALVVISLENEVDVIRVHGDVVHHVKRVFRLEIAMLALAEGVVAAVRKVLHPAHEEIEDIRIVEDAAVVPEVAFGVDFVVPFSHDRIFLKKPARIQMKETELQFGEDYYFNEEGFMVFTAAYLLKRGYCCQSGCRHCPYGFHQGQEGAKPPPGDES